MPPPRADKNLGPAAQQEFSKTWGVGYALNSASEWQDVFVTAGKAALLVAILDALRLSKNSAWFEEHGACCTMHCRAHACADAARARAVDFVSMQSVLFNGAARSWWAQTRTLVKLQARLTEDD